MEVSAFSECFLLYIISEILSSDALKLAAFLAMDEVKRVPIDEKVQQKLYNDTLDALAANGHPDIPAFSAAFNDTYAKLVSRPTFILGVRKLTPGT